MTEPKNGLTKPRLSLLSSRQSAVISKPDSLNELASVKIQQNQPPSPTHLGGFSASGATTTSVTSGNMDASLKELTPNDSHEQELARRLNGTNTQMTDENKMNISKADLIRLLSMLKSELQSKELALAAIKCEQLKRLINPVEINRSSLANTYMELQDRLKAKDRNNNGSSFGKTVLEPMKGDSDLENLNILNTLLELLDRHPLLALPRDSIYCLDYNCSELSTKNYLNLKIRHLDNLINQHKRYRYYMSERLRICEQRLLDVSQELETERNSKYETESINYKKGGHVALLKHVSQLKDVIEKEKNDKQALVMTLLNDLLDAKEQVETLKKELKNYKLVESGMLGESDRREAKSSDLSTNKDGAEKVEKASNDLQNKVNELEKENKALKARLEQQEWRLAAILKPEKTPPVTRMSTTTTSTVSNQSRANSNARTSFTRSRQTSLNSSSPTPVQASTTSSRFSSNLTKATPPSKPRVPAKPAQLVDQQRNSK